MFLHPNEEDVIQEKEEKTQKLPSVTNGVNSAMAEQKKVDAFKTLAVRGYQRDESQTESRLLYNSPSRRTTTLSKYND